MTSETIIKKVREELGVLDERAEQFVATLKNVLQGSSEAPSHYQSEGSFVSSNITPEEYEALPREDKRRYIADAEKVNKRWVENQLKRLNAKWMMVIDGQVVMHGATLDTYPEDEDFFALCDKTGKYPFVFISPRVFAIEERPVAWHETNEPDDAYPALSVTIWSTNKHFDGEHPSFVWPTGAIAHLQQSIRAVLFCLAGVFCSNYAHALLLISTLAPPR